ncbi:unnamed protein product [Soboliphyme baturini]|uniref:RRM domain-containing protein n=1 Tax=Soboliphyme baturini TaxID=241478 RepID=A0A183IQL1_9BILA|nr:unnamed protein product [Soboliphyme baturini]
MAGTRVYIGRLPYKARERDVEEFFKGYGRIREILLKNGFGFVEFDDPRDADDAVYNLNGRELCGERYGPPSQTRWRLIVENLSTRISWQDLKDFMRQAGEVTYADAHLCFSSYSDLKKALDTLDGTELNGRKIKLIDASRRYANAIFSVYFFSTDSSINWMKQGSRSTSNDGSVYATGNVTFAHVPFSFHAI